MAFSEMAPFPCLQNRKERERLLYVQLLFSNRCGKRLEPISKQNLSRA